MSLFSDPRWSEASAHLPDYLGNHLRVSLAALALGLVISLPLQSCRATGRCCVRRRSGSPASCRRCRGWRCWRCLSAAAGAGRADAVLVRHRLFRLRISARGAGARALLMLPVLRNTITGLSGVDAALIEAAQGVGMTPRQSLFIWSNCLLALPVMMAGIRTAAVWVIGTATLSTPIGQTSLGNYIFAGLQTQNWVFVLFGCLRPRRWRLRSTSCWR